MKFLLDKNKYLIVESSFVENGVESL